MAIIRLAPPFDAYHGTVSGVAGSSKLTIFSTAKAAGVSRQWVVPANPQSTAQMLMRSYQIAGAAAYSALTPAQAAEWVDAAEQLNYENILHLSYTLSGINLFVMINAYRQIRGDAIIDACPTITMPPIPTEVTAVTLSTPTTLEIISKVPGLETDGWVLIRLTKPLSSAVRQARPNELRIVDDGDKAIIKHSVGTVTHTLTVTSGDYAVADRVGVELRSLSTAFFPGPKYLEPNTVILDAP